MEECEPSTTETRFLFDILFLTGHVFIGKKKKKKTWVNNKQKEKIKATLYYTT